MNDACAQCGLYHPAGTSCLVVALTTPDTSTLQRGDLLAGRYRIERTVHHGGMSIVYLAEDTLMQGRLVALKELRPPEGSTAEELHEAEAWFARESALLSVLRHPLIPGFYSVFRENGRSYIAQEYVPGTNLDDLVRQQGPIDEEKVISWGIALSKLLIYLHGLPEQVIFRDLKPANILLRSAWSEPERRLAVVDFGIARAYQHETIGTVIGTPGYAPPEQYQGLATPQSDVYALGATLHRLLTGYDPEHDGQEDTLFSFPAIRDLNPGVSERLATIVERAMALAPANRYESAAEMHAALEMLDHAGDTGFNMAPQSRGNMRSGGRAFSLMAVALLVPLLLSQALRTAQVSFQSDAGPFHDGGYYNQPMFAPADGYTPASDNCRLLAQQSTLTLGASGICGPGGGWLIDTQDAMITHVDGNGNPAQFSIPARYATDTVTVSQPTTSDYQYWLLSDEISDIVRVDATGHFIDYHLPKPGPISAATVTPQGELQVTWSDGTTYSISSAGPGVISATAPVENNTTVLAPGTKSMILIKQGGGQESTILGAGATGGTPNQGNFVGSPKH